MDCPSSSEEDPKSPVKLARHEPWHRFLVRAAQGLFKAGPLIPASQEDENGQRFASSRSHAALQNRENYLLCLNPLLPHHLWWSARNETSWCFVSFDSRSCCTSSRSFSFSSRLSLTAPSTCRSGDCQDAEQPPAGCCCQLSYTDLPVFNEQFQQLFCRAQSELVQIPAKTKVLREQ